MKADDLVLIVYQNILGEQSDKVQHIIQAIRSVRSLTYDMDDQELDDWISDLCEDREQRNVKEREEARKRSKEIQEKERKIRMNNWGLIA